MEDLKNNSLHFAFFGSTQYSKELLLFLIDNGFVPKIIFSIPHEFSISYSPEKVVNSNYANLKEIADAYEIEFKEVDSLDGMRIKDYEPILKEMRLDLLLVLGWYYMIPQSTRELTRYGAWGIHASLLPKYAGGAPLVWAMINGEKEVGVTLFKMDDGVDDGDIIAQKSFEIGFEDSIKDVYGKATIASKEILTDALGNMQKVCFKQQDKSKIEIYPQRVPEDGEIDFSKNAIDIYNFIRAQSSPYPGAFFRTVDGKKIIIEKARVGDV